MIRFATIGTSWITSSFIEAAQSTEKYQLRCVYSRKPKQAQAFAERHGALRSATSLEELAQSSDIDAVYIASPNSLHCQQALLFLNHGKHVICEKPMASNFAEAQLMVQAAKDNNRVLFEAFKTRHLPNFSVIREALPGLGKIHKVFFNYCQYSSRYPLYLDGKNPNTFNPDFSNGSIMDIGFYCLSSAVALWGKPQSVTAQAHLLDSGVDGHGSVVLKYPDMEVIIQHAKVCDSFVDSEICGEKGSLRISHLSECRDITLHARNQPETRLAGPQHDNTMIYEAGVFADLVNGQKEAGNYQEASLITAELLTEIRKQTGVVFPADK